MRSAWPPTLPCPSDALDGSEIHPLLGVFPAAFVVGGSDRRPGLPEREAALGVGLDEAAAHMRVQARAAGRISGGVIAGVASSLVLTYAAASRKLGLILFALLVTLVAGGAFVIASRSAYGSTPGLSPASVGIARRHAPRLRARPPFSDLSPRDRRGLGARGQARALGPRHTPGMPVRDVVVDLVAEPGV